MPRSTTYIKSNIWFTGLLICYRGIEWKIINTAITLTLFIILANFTEICTWLTGDNIWISGISDKGIERRTSSASSWTTSITIIWALNTGSLSKIKSCFANWTGSPTWTGWTTWTASFACRCADCSVIEKACLTCCTYRSATANSTICLTSIWAWLICCWLIVACCTSSTSRGTTSRAVSIASFAGLGCTIEIMVCCTLSTWSSVVARIAIAYARHA